jgi:hypothetical protein
MKKINLLFFAIFIASFSFSQTVAGFENLTLGADTFWNGSDWSGGFSSGEAYFVNSYDTSGGYAFWSGFAYSDMYGDTTATVDTPLTNALQYSAVTGSGYGGHGNYAVASDFGDTKVYLTGNAIGKVVSGFYATNNVYAFLSMKYGDDYEPAFSYSNSDTFVLKITGWNNGQPVKDTVAFYLADFRDSLVSPGIITNWEWVDLHRLGNVDSLIFSLVTSQNGPYGSNTPFYFCIDNFTTSDSTATSGIQDVSAMESNVYPNPFSNTVKVSYTGQLKQICFYDMQGSLLKIISGGQITGTTEIDAADLASGVYLAKVVTDQGTSAVRIVKQ